MKKPLREPWFTASMEQLFEVLTPEQVAEQLVTTANDGNENARRWLDEIVSSTKPRKGIVSTRYDDAVLDKLLAAADYPTVVHFPVLTDAREIRWERSYFSTAETGDVYATALIRVIEAGLLKRIRYCALADCGRLFFGDVRARWCSETCGSKYRVRAKRKRDKQ